MDMNMGYWILEYGKVFLLESLRQETLLPSCSCIFRQDTLPYFSQEPAQKSHRITDIRSAFQVYSYGYGDLYTHHGWIYALIQGNVFPEGKKRCISPAKYLSKQKISRDQKDRHMNSLQKQKYTVHFDAKHCMHTVNEVCPAFGVSVCTLSDGVSEMRANQ